MSETNTIAAPGDDENDNQKPADPFAPENLVNLRISQDFGAMSPVKPVITTVPVRKPNKHEFVRVRPGSEWSIETYCFVDKENREVYLISPALVSEMLSDATPVCLRVAISKNSTLPFLWPLPIPDSDRPNRWHVTGNSAAELAEKKWLRLVADVPAGQYVPVVAVAELPGPVWPDDLQMSDLIRLAFQKRFIEDFSHPILQRLRGEI